MLTRSLDEFQMARRKFLGKAKVLTAKISKMSIDSNDSWRIIFFVFIKSCNFVQIKKVKNGIGLWVVLSKSPYKDH